MKNHPVQIEIGEWWYKGCFIQEQDHPKLAKYRVFKDTEKQEEVGTSTFFIIAKILCEHHEVKNYKYGAQAFL